MYFLIQILKFWFVKLNNETKISSVDYFETYEIKKGVRDLLASVKSRFTLKNNKNARDR